MQFNPATGSHATNSTFDVEIIVDTENVDTRSADAVINFDNTVLSVDSVAYGTFYPTVLHTEQNNKIYISGVNADAAIKGKGTLATITFKALTAGTASLSFACTAGRTDDSNVGKNDLDATDILTCSALQSASYTLTGTSVNPTAVPTAATGTSGTGTTGTGSTTTTGTGSTTQPLPDRIADTGSLDFLPLLPKLLMGVFFLGLGLIPILI